MKRFHTVITGCRVEPFLCFFIFFFLLQEYPQTFENGISINARTSLNSQSSTTTDASIFNRETKKESSIVLKFYFSILGPFHFLFTFINKVII